MSCRKTSSSSAVQLRFAKSRLSAITCLGNGSNILFADEGFSGVVIDVSALDAEIAVGDTVLTAGAGVRLAGTV